MRDAPKAGLTDHSPRAAPVSSKMALVARAAARCFVMANRSRRLTGRPRRKIDGELDLFLVGSLTVVIGLAMAFLPGVGLLSLSLRRERR